MLWWLWLFCRGRVRARSAGFVVVIVDGGSGGEGVATERRRMQDDGGPADTVLAIN